jgi:hypothetical protein
MIKIVYQGGGETITHSWEDAEKIGEGCAKFIFGCKKPSIKVFRFCIIDWLDLKSTIYEYEKQKGKLSCTIY